MRRLAAVVIVITLMPVASWPQNSVVGWSAFDMGYGVPASTSRQVQSVAGQLFVGTSLSTSTRLESGFLGHSDGSSGYPPNSGMFTVTTTNDSGQGSLRLAMQTSNTTPGVNIITFNIPGSGVHTITPLSAFPVITDPVFIDGYSQPGSHPNTNGPEIGSNAVLLIELNGTNINPGLGGTGLLIRDGNSTIRGLVINRTPNAGILMQYGSNNVIEGNFIGTDPTGTIAMGNVYGVLVETPGSNYRIGGTTPAARNVVSGNSAVGVGFGVVAAGGSNHVVQGNLIGTNAAGTAPLPNGVGVSLANNVNNVLIGGDLPGARNVISCNGSGISISNGIGSPLVSHNQVQGNFIGTDVTGSTALGNTQNGVAIDGLNNIVGGSAPGARNIISGNGGYGLYIFSGDSSAVQGNYIGTDVTGNSPIGNHSGGIYLVGSDITVGGTEPGAGNTIMFNGTLPSHAGIVVVGSSQRDAILGNSISANAGLGIDLGGGFGPDGVTANDSCDVDTLVANNYQNFPVLISALPASGNTIVQGTLNSRPNSLFRIEFFANPTRDSTGYGEGKAFLGFASVLTNSSCVASFVDTLSVLVPLGYYISATATDARGNTSEFSRAIPVGTTGVHGTGSELPKTFELSQNYPNPFNPSTTLRYGLPHASFVTLTVYNTLGQQVAQLVNEQQQAGYHEVVFRGDGLASGVYFYRLDAGSFTSVKKLLLLK